MRMRIGSNFKCERAVLPFRDGMEGFFWENHMRKHNGQMLQYPCCDYKTIHLIILKIRKHTGDAFKCESCEYEIIYSYAMARHNFEHTEKKFKYKHFDHSTIYPTAMKNHSRRQAHRISATVISANTRKLILPH